VTLHRFFVPPESLVGDRVSLPADLVHQVARVLRLRAGDQILVLDDHGREQLVRLDQVDARAVRGTSLETRTSRAEPGLRLTLYQALLPREKLEHVLQKGTEVGIAAFVPVATARSLADKDSVSDVKLRRWRTVVREAAEQSERGRLPQVMPALSFSEALAEARTAGPLLLAWEREAQRGPSVALETLSRAGRGSLFVGPEGGFTASEIEQAREAGALVIGLGPRILRAETCGPLLAALALYGAGEMEPRS
jgi:16S rRNA (uracil1498-N3)-methyltransferase